MSVKKVLKDIDFSVPKEDMKTLKEEAKRVVGVLQNIIKEKKIDADVFVGGSFAKGSLAKDKEYDVDIFIRFDWKYEDLSKYLEKIVKDLGGKLKIERVHGSRDYFKARDGNITFEIIPVSRITKPREMRNVTDLSYFHVRYVKRKLKNEKARNELLLAKAFCKASRVYGAESYIQGFSGYGLECLIIQYGTFERMAKAFAKLKKGERLILDPEKKYKKKGDIVFELNEARIQGPIILVDPTWKERNVLAALNWESFERLQVDLKKFLKKPGKKFFEVKDFDVDKFKKKTRKGEEFLEIRLKTGRQAGDIAGTKLKKFGRFLESKVKEYFEVKGKEFDYFGGQEGALYLRVKRKKEIMRIGPPASMEKSVEAFRKQNKGKKIVVKNGLLHVKERVNFSGKKFIAEWAKGKNNRKTMKDMGILGLKVV